MTALGRSLALAFAVLSVAPFASADDVTARCARDAITRDIPGFTMAQIDDRPTPNYPRRALDDWSEGWVSLEYAVTADGEVRDVAVVDAIGSKEFVASAVKAVGRWSYNPATRNGVSVEQHLQTAAILYLFDDSSRGADHQTFVRRFDMARLQIQNGQYDAAIATLEEAFGRRLNHYEQAMGSYALALAYAKKSEWPRALFHIRHAVIENLEYLEPQVKSTTLTLQVELEARNGNLQEAICAFQDLRRIDPQAARADGASAKTVARITTALAAPGPIAIDAQLAKHPLVDAPAVWRHQLLRSKFSFDQIKGDVTSFKLKCVGTTHSAAVDAATRWDVPTQAGACILQVEGAPGATFRLLEE